MNFQIKANDVFNDASYLIGKKFTLKINETNIDAVITKNSIEKNLRWDNWFDKRCYSIMNMPDLIKNSNHIGSNYVTKNNFSDKQWVRKQKIKAYHFFVSKNGMFQFDIEERWDGQITVYNIKVLK
ncbi:MAG TPA: hypothetical protein PLI65_06375 [Bacteroidales bacterium]|nr:hypothetical protein [Bacteroidales bacterium]